MALSEYQFLICGQFLLHPGMSVLLLGDAFVIIKQAITMPMHDTAHALYKLSMMFV